LIALYSPAPQYGKTTVANFLNAGCGYQKMKFAYPMKAMIYALLFSAGVDQEGATRLVEGDLKDEWIPALKSTPRNLMQTLGTEWGRKTIHEDLWVNLLEATLDDLLGQGKKVVIDDMRFQNEFDLINKLGGTTVKVMRRTMDQVTLHSSEGVLTHQEFDYILDNNGSVTELHQQVAGIIGEPLEGATIG